MDRETVDNARKELKDAYTKYEILKISLLEAEGEWMKKKKIFEKYDYELALEDGRRTILPPAGTKKTPAKPVELSLEQILSIATQLGISIEDTTITTADAQEVE